MGLSYQTEYRLGARGGQIRRTYTGCHAFVAIVIDLALGSIFGSVGLLFKLVRLALLACLGLVVGVAQFVVWLLAAPFRMARRVSRRLRHHRTPRKPAWAGLEDF